jgi:hypothetical protein
MLQTTQGGEKVARESVCSRERIISSNKTAKRNGV